MKNLKFSFLRLWVVSGMFISCLVFMSFTGFSLKGSNTEIVRNEEKKVQQVRKDFKAHDLKQASAYLKRFSISE